MPPNPVGDAPFVQLSVSFTVIFSIGLTFCVIACSCLVEGAVQVPSSMLSIAFEALLPLGSCLSSLEGGGEALSVTSPAIFERLFPSGFIFCVISGCSSGDGEREPLFAKLSVILEFSFGVTFCVATGCPLVEGGFVGSPCSSSLATFESLYPMGLDVWVLSGLRMVTVFSGIPTVDGGVVGGFVAGLDCTTIAETFGLEISRAEASGRVAGGKG